MTHPSMMGLPEEQVPDSKRHMISTRENSYYKWQASNVVGALEIPSEPDLDYRLEYEKRPVSGQDKRFETFMTDWDELKLGDEFIKACEGIPLEVCCCGLMTHTDNTIKSMASLLNEGWMTKTNERLLKEGKEFQMDAFIWSCNNATGKAETLILLIRFFDISAESSPRSS
jgi:hypothetical protein